MCWLGFLILAYVVLGLDVGLRWPLRGSGVVPAMPDLVLPAVLFLAMAAPRNAALMGALILGLARDLAMPQPLGLHGLAYGLAALLVTAVRDGVDTRHVTGRAILALISSLVVGVIVYVHHLIHGPATPLWTVCQEIVYSAAVAMVGLWMLGKAKRWVVMDAYRRP